MLNTQLKLQEASRKNVLSAGFTLIELLVVIVILAILAVAVIVAINPTQRFADATNSRAQANLASFGSSAGQYAAQYGVYPTAFGASGGGAFPAWTVGAQAGYTYKLVGGQISIDVAATAEPNANPPVTLALWCYRSATGTVTNAATCAP
jgi:prepilin-type N-terminal cleavage/methylation domain-containing protein